MIAWDDEGDGAESTQGHKHVSFKLGRRTLRGTIKGLKTGGRAVIKRAASVKKVEHPSLTISLFLKNRIKTR